MEKIECKMCKEDITDKVKNLTFLSFKQDENYKEALCSDCHTKDFDLSHNYYVKQPIISTLKADVYRLESRLNKITDLPWYKRIFKSYLYK